MFQQFPPDNQMIDGKKHSDLFCVDAASSTQGCPTPSITMSEDTPIREETDESFEEDDDSSDGYSDEVEDIDASHDNHFHCIEHHPISHKRYMIRTRKEPRRILVLSCGALKMTSNPESNSRAFPWICIQFGNWWTFRSVASNTHLGHDGAGKVVATNMRLGGKEYFVPVRQEGGGYILHTFHPKRGELLQVAEDDDGVSLVEVEKGGTAFDFIDVKYQYCSAALGLPDMEEFGLVKRDW